MEYVFVDENGKDLVFQNSRSMVFLIVQKRRTVLPCLRRVTSNLLPRQKLYSNLNSQP